jgi:hypothetical protein
MICKILPQTTASYSGSYKILQRQTLSWDCPFNTQKSKQFNLVSKAPENMIRDYYLKIGFVLLLFLDNGRFVSGPPIHAQVQQAFAKTA